MWKDKTSHSLC